MREKVLASMKLEVGRCVCTWTCSNYLIFLFILKKLEMSLSFKKTLDWLSCLKRLFNQVSTTRNTGFPWNGIWKSFLSNGETIFLDHIEFDIMTSIFRILALKHLTSESFLLKSTCELQLMKKNVHLLWKETKFDKQAYFKFAINKCDI